MLGLPGTPNPYPNLNPYPKLTAHKGRAYATVGAEAAGNPRLTKSKVTLGPIANPNPYPSPNPNPNPSPHPNANPDPDPNPHPHPNPNQVSPPKAQRVGAEKLQEDIIERLLELSRAQRLLLAPGVAEV